MPQDKKNAGGKSPGRWKKGESGNPGGCPAGTRERREHIARLLDKVFELSDGGDLLVDAIVDGVAERDSTCLKLACAYRLGSPEQFVQLYGEGGGPLRLGRPLTDEELEAIAAQALPKKDAGK